MRRRATASLYAASNERGSHRRLFTPRGPSRHIAIWFVPSEATLYNALRVALGLLLLGAAALKGYELATTPALGGGLLESRWVLAAVVELELLFGLWLLAGLYLRETRLAALCCFGVFACVWFYKAVSGEASCGCFGRLVVSPWRTLILDLAVLGALIFVRPPPQASKSLRSFRGTAGAKFAMAVLVSVYCAAAVPAAIAMRGPASTFLTADGSLPGDGEYVILEPQAWVGKRFPLLEQIDIGDRLAAGRWMVLLYHYDCPRCREAIGRYCELARTWVSAGRPDRVAFVEVPPYGELPVPLGLADAPCLLGGLSDRRKWFVETPAIVWLDNGTVVAERGALVERGMHEGRRTRIEVGLDLPECAGGFGGL